MRITPTRRSVALVGADGLVIAITTRPVPLAQAENIRA